jgi:magnesium chelatase family protein
MLASVTSAALIGIEAEAVQVEVNANQEGEPRLNLIGLPDAAVKESSERVVSTFMNAGYFAVRTHTTINLAPGGLKKEGAMYDLPIALGLLSANGQLPPEALHPFVIAGELSLSGATRPVRGGLAIARLARRLGVRSLLLPPITAEEAALLEGVRVYRADSFAQAVKFLKGAHPLEPLVGRDLSRGAEPEPPSGAGNFSEVKGQHALRRAIEVAVAGAHNLLVVGPPGGGKSMVAKRIPTIMPPPTNEEYMDILSIRSVAGKTIAGGHNLECVRPFRSPHHTVSDIALIGGGPNPRPGEISLAHHGVLFLDELPEFRRSTLEVMRQPLEDGEVTISRQAAKITYPCSFMLVAAMNPCPCGHSGDPRRPCRCTPAQIEKYRRKISGPLLDRIDIHVEAPALTFSELRSGAEGEPSAAIRERVIAARNIQTARYANCGVAANAKMTQQHLRHFCALDSTLGDLLQAAMERLNLSARAYSRILKVARTIADLAAADKIEAAHLLEAIQYRALDRNPPP